MSLMNEGSIEIWDVERLKPYEKNAKIHGDKQIESLAGLIHRNGWTQPIVAQKSSGVIIAGHGRRLAALHLGLKKVPVCVIDCTDDEARAMRLSDNRVASQEYDTGMIQGEIFDLNELGFDMSLLAMTDKELAFLTSDIGAIDATAFVEDVSEAVETHKEETSERIEAFNAVEVPLSKAFGFKKITAAQTRQIKAHMGKIEIMTGKTGIEALLSLFEDFGVLE